MSVGKAKLVVAIQCINFIYMLVMIGGETFLSYMGHDVKVKSLGMPFFVMV